MSKPAKKALDQILALHPTAVVTDRRKNSIMADTGASMATVTSIGAMHYDDAGVWREIDTTWQPAVGEFQHEMLNGPYLASARSAFNAGEVVEYRARSGEWVRFQPLALNWRDENNSQQQIGIPQAVTTVVTGEDSDTLSWPAAYGAGRHFSWRAHPSRLQKLLTVDAASDLPTPAAWLTGAIDLELTFAFTYDSAVTAFVDGVAWDRSTTVTSGNAIEFRNASGETLWHFTTPKAWDSATEPTEATGVMSFYRVGNTRHVSVRVPRSFVDAAVFPIFVDPTVTVDVTAGLDDGQMKAGTVALTLTSMAFDDGSAPQYTFMRFVAVGIPNGATIDAATYTVDAANMGSAGSSTGWNNYAEDIDNAVVFSSSTDGSEQNAVLGRLTSATAVHWQPSAWVYNAAYTSPDLSAHVQEVVNRAGWASGNALRLVTTGETAGTAIFAVTYEHSSLPAPSLYVEYTTGPTGTTVEPPAATLTTTGYAPTPQASDHKTVVPTLGALTATGFAPTVEATSLVEVDVSQVYAEITTSAGSAILHPPLTAATLARLAPTLATTDHQVVTAEVAAAFLNAFAPTLLNDVNVTGVESGLLATGYAPFIDAEAHITLTPSEGQAALTGYAPAVNAGAAQTVTPLVGVATLAGLEPAVINPVTVVPTEGAAALTGYAPTLDNNVVTRPLLSALTTTGAAPVINATAHVTVQPLLTNATVTGFAPAVLAGASITVEPGLASASVAGYAPTLLNDVTVTANTGILTTESFAPVILNDVTTVIPTRELAITGLIPAALATAHLRIEPFAGALTTEGASPTVARTEHVVLHPNAAAANLAGGTPDLQRTGHALLKPPSRAAVLTGRQPIISHDQNVVLGPDVTHARVTGAIPTVDFTAHAPLDVPLATVQVDGFRAEILATANAPLNVPTTALTTTGYAPAVLATADIPLDIPAVTAQVTGFAPTTLATADAPVSVPLATVTLAGAEPTTHATAHAPLDVPAASVIVTGYEPAVLADASVNIQALAATLDLAGLTPAIGASASVILEVGVRAAALTGLAPSVRTPVTTQAGVANLAASSTTPQIGTTAHRVISVPVSALDMVSFAPTVRAPTTVTVPVSAAEITGTTPTVLAPERVQVPTGTVTLAGITPSLDVTAGYRIDPLASTLRLTGRAPSLASTDWQIVKGRVGVRGSSEGTKRIEGVSDTSVDVRGESSNVSIRGET